jgi:hypothetical protein
VCRALRGWGHGVRWGPGLGFHCPPPTPPTPLERTPYTCEPPPSASLSQVDPCMSCWVLREALLGCLLPKGQWLTSFASLVAVGNGMSSMAKGPDGKELAFAFKCHRPGKEIHVVNTIKYFPNVDRFQHILVGSWRRRPPCHPLPPPLPLMSWAL